MATHTHTHTHIYRERERERERPADQDEQQNFDSSTCLTSSPINQDPALTSSWA